MNQAGFKLMKYFFNLQACEVTNTPYRRIIQPVETRWNSLEAAMDSVVKLKDALLYIKVNSPTLDLSTNTPSRHQFDVIVQLLRTLSTIRSVSEKLSSDKIPTLHLVSVNLVLLNNLAKGFRDECPEVAKSFIQSFEFELNQRMPDFGREEFLYNAGNLLHPKYKGSTLSYDGNRAAFEKTKQDKKQEDTKRQSTSTDT